MLTFEIKNMEDTITAALTQGAFLDGSMKYMAVGKVLSIFVFLLLFLLFRYDHVSSALVFSLSYFHVNSLTPAISYYLPSVCIYSVSRWSYDRPLRACGSTRISVIILREIRNKAQREHRCENGVPYETKSAGIMRLFTTRQKVLLR